MANNIKAIKFLGWRFLRIAIDDYDKTKPLTFEGGISADGGTGAGTSAVSSVNEKTGNVVLSGDDINATIVDGEESKTATITEHLQALNEDKLNVTGGNITGAVSIATTGTMSTADQIPLLLKSNGGGKTGNFAVLITPFSGQIGLGMVNSIDLPLFGIYLDKYGAVTPISSSKNSIGNKYSPWKNVFAQKLNNGNDIDIPTGAGTLALSEDVINNDASTYDLTSLSSLFTSFKAKLVKVHAESKMPTTGAYTVLSLGWTMTDSENMPALLAVELATGKLFYYHGTENNCTADAWKEFSFGATSDDGLKGDYCATYSVTRWPNGLPTISSSVPNTIDIPAGLELDIPGTKAAPSNGLLTIASAQSYTLKKSKTCWLAYIPGLDEPFVECEQLCFSKTMPAESNATCRAWFDGEEWKYRDINHGDVWRPTRMHILARCIFTGDVLTRLSYIGWYSPIKNS